MDKSVYIIRDEMMRNIFNAIRDSGLHLIVVEPVLKEILTTVQEAIREQHEKDLEEYRKWLEEEKEVTKDGE